MNDNRKQIAVYGAGGFGLEVAMLIEQININSRQWEIVGFFDDAVWLWAKSSTATRCSGTGKH